MIEIKKIFRKFFTIEIGRPIVYKAFYKFLLALVPILIWDRFVNIYDYYSMVETGFFIAGAVYLMLAWINYLKIDGMHIYGVEDMFKNRDKNKAQKKNGGLMDYVQQDIPDYDDLSDEDKMIAKFGSNILIGLVFMIISFIAIIF